MIFPQCLWSFSGDFIEKRKTVSFFLQLVFCRHCNWFDGDVKCLQRVSTHSLDCVAYNYKYLNTNVLIIRRETRRRDDKDAVKKMRSTLHIFSQEKMLDPAVIPTLVCANWNPTMNSSADVQYTFFLSQPSKMPHVFCFKVSETKFFKCPARIHQATLGNQIERPGNLLWSFLSMTSLPYPWEWLPRRLPLFWKERRLQKRLFNNQHTFSKCLKLMISIFKRIWTRFWSKKWLQQLFKGKIVNCQDKTIIRHTKLFIF